MKVAGMQPYLFPYIGYFQLIQASDIFVLGDELQYIDKGWINRNNVLCKKGKEYGAQLFTLPVDKSSRLHPINEGCFSSQFDFTVNKFLKSLETNYSKAPYFSKVFPLIQEILSYEDHNLAGFLRHSLEKTLDYLQVKTKIVAMSDWEGKDFHQDSFEMEERVIYLCKSLKADQYINAIGGQNLYHKDTFAENGIELSFIQTDDICYPQYGNEFVANLSIIDVMMFNSVDEIKELLNQYTLI